MKIFSLCFLVMTQFACSVSAHADDAGVVHFSGKITESTCPAEYKDSRITYSCYLDGKDKFKEIELSQLDKTKDHLSPVEKVEIKYIDNIKSAAILTIAFR